MAENEYVIVNKADFEKIGNAVRASNGTTDKYSEMVRLVADEGKALTDGTNTTTCTDVSSAEGWTEIDALKDIQQT